MARGCIHRGAELRSPVGKVLKELTMDWGKYRPSFGNAGVAMVVVLVERFVSRQQSSIKLRSVMGLGLDVHIHLTNVIKVTLKLSLC